MSARCPDCGLRRWDDADLLVSEMVCICDELGEIPGAECPCGNGCWDQPDRPIVTVDTGGLM